MKHILHVVGARPNFMKLAPVLHALAERGVRQHVVHTGQHYDVNMSDAIFRELRLPEPDVNLGVGSGSHAEQTAEILVGMERCLGDFRPDAALVYGDSNSTMAATLAASKAGVPVGHVEAGLRSDRSPHGRTRSTASSPIACRPGTSPRRPTPTRTCSPKAPDHRRSRASATS